LNSQKQLLHRRIKKMVVVIDEDEYSIESSNADSSILGGVEEDKK